jgi:hypothetical protein
VEESSRRGNTNVRRVLSVLALASLTGVACDSTSDDRPGAFGGGAGAGASGGTHGGHGGSAGSGGAGGTNNAGSSGRAGSGGSAGSLSDAGLDAAPDAPNDAQSVDAGPAVNGCIAYEDRTSGDTVQTLAWNDDIAFAPERCMKIRVGQIVAFAGDARTTRW